MRTKKFYLERAFGLNEEVIAAREELAAAKERLEAATIANRENAILMEGSPDDDPEDENS